MVSNNLFQYVIFDSIQAHFSIKFMENVYTEITFNLRNTVIMAEPINLISISEQSF
jgi:hypothetical protein